MKIGIDYTSAATQGAGIGRYTRELMRALLALPSDNHYSSSTPAATAFEQSSSQQSAVNTSVVCPSTTNG